MKSTYFEVHIHENQKLPFIFRKNVERTKLSSNTLSWHPAVEICRCVSGSGRITCNTTTYDFNEGDIFIINSNSLHSITSNTHLVFDCIIIDESFFLENAIDIKNIIFENTVKNEETLQLFTHAGNSFFDNTELRTARIRSNILNLILHICDNYSHKNNSFTKAESVSVELTKIAIGYINSHLTDKLTLDILATETGVSKYHLCHEFKKVTNYTVFSYINICRCKKAAKMLLENDATVHDTCLACGFDNLSYFIRTFKKYYGTSPSAYKKEKKEDRIV